MTQAVVYKQLQDAITGLNNSNISELEKDLPDLQASAGAALSDAGQYTTISINNLSSALNTIKLLSSDASADDTQKAVVGLSSALDNLVKSSGLTDLASTIDSATPQIQNSSASANYVSSDWANFNNSYNYAVSVLNNPVASADQISNAKAQLEKSATLLSKNSRQIIVSQLNDAISGGNALLSACSGSAFDPSTTGVLKSAVNSASVALASALTSPDILKSDSSAIISGISQLKTTFEVTSNKLDSLINGAVKITGNGLTQDSFNSLTTTLNQAINTRYSITDLQSLKDTGNNLRLAIWSTVPTNSNLNQLKKQFKICNWGCH